MKIDARGMHYRDLNERINEAVDVGETDLILENVNGQRYIGAGLGAPLSITVHGVPGNDLGAFMDGASVTVDSNAQDGIGNTMNGGSIVVHGSAGDIVGNSMRRGRILVRGDVGYRVGIHMKSYAGEYPVLTVGGTAGDFLGEYMAGGVLVVLGLCRADDYPIVGSYCGTGMHGGAIYLRGDVEDHQLGKEVARQALSADDTVCIEDNVRTFCDAFGLSPTEIMDSGFIKLAPHSSRPYGRIYAY